MGLLAEALEQPEQEAPTEASVEAEEAAAGPSGDKPLLPPQVQSLKACSQAEECAVISFWLFIIKIRYVK